MKRFIFVMLLSAGLALGLAPGSAQARVHHRRVRARHTRVVYRTVYPGSRSHGVNANGNVGVGLGPIHVGVGAGGGLGIHAFPPQKAVPESDPVGVGNDRSSNDPTADPPPVNDPPKVLCPSVDPASGCNVMAMAVDTITSVDTMAIVPAPVQMEHFALSPDTNVNNYYATYALPNVVTVGGFDVPVANDRMYFSPFRHRHGAAWHVHNEKGVDQTAGYGISPRAGPIPESIGGSGYTVTTIE